MGPLCPLEVFDVFGRKCKFKALRAFIFGTKWVPIEVNNWWKFGVDISNHFWEIENWIFCLFNSSPNRHKIVFENSFFYLFVDELKEKKTKIWISQEWFVRSTPIFYHLLTLISTCFTLKIKAIGVLDLDFPPKTSKTSNGRSRRIFWATPSKFGENSLLS